jgi:hypothetical protein
MLKLLLFCLLPLTAHAEAPFGTVKLVQGEVTRKTKDLHEGDELNPGDEIVTGHRGIARLLLSQGVAMQIGPGSRVVLEKGKHGAPTTVELFKGYLLSKIRKDGDGIKYRVRTKTASLGVRGTTFFAKQEPDGRTFVCVCEGTVVTTWDKGEKLITSKHHDAPTWVEAGNPKGVKAPMGDEHNDEEIAALAALLR